MPGGVPGRLKRHMTPGGVTGRSERPVTPCRRPETAGASQDGDWRLTPLNVLKRFDRLTTLPTRHATPQTSRDYPVTRDPPSPDAPCTPRRPLLVLGAVAVP
eukprot:6607058-Prymnesium_polylepis.1